MRRALVNGGSIGGLFVAAMLRHAGWDVHIFERAAHELSGRGAGIVTHDELLAMLDELGIEQRDLGIQVDERVAFGKDGAEMRRMRFPQIVTSWDRIHQLLRAQCPPDSYHLNSVLLGYDQQDDVVSVHFENGKRIEADILVGADGFASATRAQMCPEIKPVYAGYVVWRALAQESDLPPSVHKRLFSVFSFFAPQGTQVIGYPIAGAGNDLRAGHRRYNFVWYKQTSEDELSQMLSDASGFQHKITIPPPLIRDDVLATMQADADQLLPDDFCRMLAVSERPFFTPIYDHHSPVMNDGLVALAGDAACVARPHVGMGVTKAAADARALRDALSTHADIRTALKAYSLERSHASERAFLRSRQLGSYILDTYPDVSSQIDEHPFLDRIMHQTATFVC